MDLGISGRTALVCASSRGLGYACATALAKEGVIVVINGRDPERLDAAMVRMKEDAGVAVTAVCGDVTTVEGRNALLSACPAPDILINNNAGPEPRPFLSLSDADWSVALEANMTAPLAMVRSVLPNMIAQRFGRIINITSAMVTTPRPHLMMSAGARAGLTAAMKGLSLEVVRHNVTINNLLPERIDTDRQEYMAHKAMQRESIDYNEARRRQILSIAAGRLGEPREFAAACAFLCSSLAGYISGQNLHLDGGSYPALI